MMNDNECSCTLNELELFDPVVKQVTLDKAQWVDIHPINNITANAPIEFNINGSTDELLDFNNTVLQLQVKIKNATGDNLTENDIVAPINNWFHSMFADAILTIGGTQIEGGNMTYPYKAYITNLLTHNKDSKLTQLESVGWFKDVASKMNSNGTDNSGFKSRYGMVRASTQVELYGPLLFDFFTQNKYCLHNVDVGVKLIPSKPAFQSMILTPTTVTNRATAVKVEISKAVLYVRRVKAMPSFINQVEEKLNLQNALYPIQRTEITTYTIPTGNTSHNKEALFRGQMPKLVIVGFVQNDAYNGVYSENPFNFQNFGINKLAMYREGESIPSRPLEPNFEGGLYKREYISLIQAIDIFNKSEDIDLTPTEFANGYTLFGFNLTPDLNITGHAQPIRDGNIRLEVNFSKALDKTINVIIFGVFDAKIEVTKFRNVLMDWKS